MFKTLFACAALLATASMQSAEAHSKMTLPKPNSEINNSPSGTIDGPNTLTVPAGMSFGYGPAQNTEAFHKAFKAQTKYKSIRDIVYDKFQPDGASTKECGQSAMTGPPQELPEYVEYETGFDSTHEGPCEVWCDNTRVFYDENCSINYPQKPAKVPYDKSKCVGAKRLQSIWLALHVPAWQAYISCATLSGASAGGNDSESSGSDEAPAPAATTKAPAASSKAPATTSKAPTATSKAPAATTEAPSPTSAPEPATSKKPTCTKRFRRD